MRGFFCHLVYESELYFVVPSSERKFSVSRKLYVHISAFTHIEPVAHRYSYKVERK